MARPKKYLEPRSKLSIYLPENMAIELHVVAIRAKKTVSEYIEQLVGDALAKRKDEKR